AACGIDHLHDRAAGGPCTRDARADDRRTGTSPDCAAPNEPTAPSFDATDDARARAEAARGTADDARARVNDHVDLARAIKTSRKKCEIRGGRCSSSRPPAGGHGGAKAQRAQSGCRGGGSCRAPMHVRGPPSALPSSAAAVRSPSMEPDAMKALVRRHIEEGF